MKFERPGLGERVGQLGYLLKHTFTIVGRDSDIFVPVLKMSAMAVIVVCLFFGGITAVVLGNGGMGTWLILFGLVAFVFKYFYYNMTELALSRLVYETAIGNDPDGASVKQQLQGMRGRLWLLSLADMLSVWISAQRGKSGFLTRMILGGLVEIWDLVNHFLLPAFAIDKLSTREAAHKLTDLKDNVPETLVGVFGIDVAGGVVRAIIGPAYVLGGLLGLAMGLLFGGSMPEGFSGGEIGNLFPSIPAWLPFGPETVFSWMPFFIVIFLCFIGNAVLARLVTAIKVVYFTMFYARITHADKLMPEIREELEGYLNMEDAPTECMQSA